MDILELDARPFMQLLHAMLRADGSHAEIERSAQAIQWLSANSTKMKRVCTQEEWRVMTSVSEHWNQFGSAPNRESLEIVIRSHERSKAALDLLQEYETHEEHLKQITYVDMDLHLHLRIEDYRKSRLRLSLRIAEDILVGSVPAVKKGDPSLSGINDAKQYIRKALLRDVGPEKPALQGDWVEHADDIEKVLIDSLSSTERNRIFTGFRHLDEAVTIGPTESIRYVGILGFTNHGKSGYLMALLYNMARSGKRILLVPREFSVQEAWERLTFMHADYFPKLALPSLSFWKKKPHEVTKQHVANVQTVLEDLRSGQSIAGSIEVLHASNWTSIMEHLQSSKQPYDVLAIDYIGHLETVGRDRHEDVKAIFRQAQVLSRDYNGGRGLVVVTPLQANKSGASKVDEQEAEEWGCYQDLGAVEWYTQAAQDMDLVIGVWHKAWLKDSGLMKVSCVKSRGEFFPNHFVRIDTRTRYLRDEHIPTHQIGQILPQRSREDGSIDAVENPFDSPNGKY